MTRGLSEHGILCDKKEEKSFPYTDIRAPKCVYKARFEKVCMVYATPYIQR